MTAIVASLRPCCDRLAVSANAIAVDPEDLRVQLDAIELGARVSVAFRVERVASTWRRLRCE